MITIRNHKDLEKYMKIIPAKRHDGQRTLIEFEITENDDRADVVFDCAMNVPLEFDKIKEVGNYGRKFVIKANNVVFNYTITCDKIFARDIEFKDWCKITFVVGKNLKGKILQSEWIMCRSIDCDEVFFQRGYAKSLKAKRLNINNLIKFENIVVDGEAQTYYDRDNVVYYY